MKRQLFLVVVLLGSGTAFAGSESFLDKVKTSGAFADTMVIKQSGIERRAVAPGFKPERSQWEFSLQKITAFDEAAFDQYNLRLQQVLKESADGKVPGVRYQQKRQKQALKGLLLSYEAAGKWS